MSRIAPAGIALGLLTWAAGCKESASRPGPNAAPVRAVPVSAAVPSEADPAPPVHASTPTPTPTPTPVAPRPAGPARASVAWTRREVPHDTWAPLEVGRDHVLLASPHGVVAVAKATGDVAWSANASLVTASGAHVAVARKPKEKPVKGVAPLRGLDPDTGAERWADPEARVDRLMAAGDRLLVIRELAEPKQMVLEVRDPATGKVLARASAPARLVVPPSLAKDGDLAFVGGRPLPRDLAGLQAFWEGVLVLERASQAVGAGAGVVAGELESGKLLAVGADGTVRWRRDKADLAWWPAAGGDAVFAAFTTPPRVEAIVAQTGVTRWSQEGLSLDLRPVWTARGLWVSVRSPGGSGAIMRLMDLVTGKDAPLPVPGLAANTRIRAAAAEGPVLYLYTDGASLMRVDLVEEPGGPRVPAGDLGAATQVLWARVLEGDLRRRPVLGDAVLLASSERAAWGLDAPTGAKRWAHRETSQWARFLETPRLLVLGPKLRALAAKDGSRAWGEGHSDDPRVTGEAILYLDERVPGESQLTIVTPQDGIATQIAVPTPACVETGKGHAYFGLHRVPTDGDEEAFRRAIRAANAAPCPCSFAEGAGGAVHHVAGSPASLLTVSAETRVEVASVALEGACSKVPVRVSQGVAYVITAATGGAGRLHGVGLSPPAKRWSVPLPSATADLSAHPRGVMAAQGTTLALYGADKGDLLWQADLEDAVGPPLVDGERVFVGTRGGVLYALEPKLQSP